MGIRNRIAALVLAGLTLGLVACGSTYYLVKDPTSGREYYTTHVDRSGGGKVVFKDALTASTVTLQSSEVLEITKDQYKAKAGSL